MTSRHATRLGHLLHAPPRRLRAITMDVTGTVLAFNGRLGEWYALAAKRSGVALSASPEGIEHAFKQAYKETCAAHPCFGADDMATRDWWRTCVLRSFELADCDFTKDLSPTDADRLFQKVYSLFGSHKTYRAFPDAAPFLKWARARGIVTGVVSNADERYQDDILPMLGLDAFDFVVTSKSALSEKPDRRIFDVALEQARSAAERMPLQREPAWRDKLAVALNWDELADAIGSARSYVVCDEHGTNCRLVDALSKKYVACDEHGDNCRVTVDDNTHHRVVALVEDDARSAEPIDPATPISPDECLHIVEYIARHDVALGTEPRVSSST
eukprot:PRCOL_00004641-RA